ncbi:MAG: hypothetical protein R2876_01920 [Eubacteriales bacterium]
MNKYIYLLKYEFKTIVRDSMNLFMCIFPLVILFLSTVIFPMVFNTTSPTDDATTKVAMLLFLIVILAFGGFLVAAMATFLLLDHKDENTLSTIAVTPLGASGYVKFKMTYIYIMSVISTIMIFLGTKLLAGDEYAIGGVSIFDTISIWHIISFAVVSALFVPALALLQGAFAKNKVEGFAYIKGTGMIALVPALLILDAFSGGLQYLLGIFPNFWALKGIMLELFPENNAANLSYPVYLIIGAAYNILLIVMAYRVFLKKAKY